MIPDACERCPTETCPLMRAVPGRSVGTAAASAPRGTRTVLAWGCYGVVTTVRSRARRTSLYLAVCALVSALAALH